MKYYVYESKRDNNELHIKDKCRNDIRKMLTKAGYESIEIPVTHVDMSEKISLKNITRQGVDTGKNFKSWMEYIKKVRRNDIIFIQYPPYQKTLLTSILIYLKMRGAYIIGIIQDLGSYRANDDNKLIKSWATLEDAHALTFFNQIIVNNVKMRKIMQASEFNDKKLINLRLFDYFTSRAAEIPPEVRFHRTAPIVIAAEYEHVLNEKGYYIYTAEKNPDISFNIYGPGIEEKYIKNLTYEYKGVYSPDDIPLKIEGSFGLIWEGNSIESCEGNWGEYLRINNPGKASMYIAAGIPIIIWSGAALADFVKKYNIGITIDSIFEIKDKIEQITDEQYLQMINNLKPFSEAVRKGVFFKKALERAELRL